MYAWEFLTVRPDYNSGHGGHGTYGLTSGESRPVKLIGMRNMAQMPIYLTSLYR